MVSSGDLEVDGPGLFPEASEGDSVFLSLSPSSLFAVNLTGVCL